MSELPLCYDLLRLRADGREVRSAVTDLRRQRRATVLAGELRLEETSLPEHIGGRAAVAVPPTR